jgi:hypothetical protein
MAVATLEIKQYTGATPTKTAVTTPRLSTSDSANPGTSNPIPIPAASFNYSFWMSLALSITAMNDATLLNNHKFYSDGTIGWTLGTSGELRIGAQDTGDFGCPEASYDQATGTTGTTGDDLETSHTYYSSETNKSDPVSTYTSGSPATIDTTEYTATGDFKHVVLQAKVATDATRGAQSAETLTFQYDEI